MGTDEASRSAESLVRANQVKAVVGAIRQGSRPRVGDVLEHTLDRRFEPFARSWTRNPRLDRYAFQVEPWHLAEADRFTGAAGMVDGLEVFRP